MTFTPEDLGFPQSYTFDMAPPPKTQATNGAGAAGTSAPSSGPSTGTSTPYEELFSTSTSTTFSSSITTQGAAAGSLPDAIAPIQRRATDLGTGTGTGSKHPLPPHGRTFPKPNGELDVKAALARRPAAWSIQGQIDANRRREERREARARERVDEEAEEKKRQLAQVKAELLSMKKDLEEREGNQRPTFF